MKVFCILVALSIIQSAAALPGGGADRTTEGSSSVVNLGSSEPAADGDSSTDAVNERLPTCPEEDPLTRITDRLTDLSRQITDDREECQLIDTGLELLLREIQAKMKDLDRYAPECREEVRHGLNEIEQHVHALQAMNADAYKSGKFGRIGPESDPESP
jgi:archaellum component FlaC